MLNVMSYWAWCHAERDVMLSSISCWAWCHAECEVMLSVMLCWAWCYAKREVMLSVMSCWAWGHAECAVMLSLMWRAGCRGLCHPDKGWTPCVPCKRLFLFRQPFRKNVRSLCHPCIDSTKSVKGKAHKLTEVLIVNRLPRKNGLMRFAV